jgi:hypothetical protein
MVVVARADGLRGGVPHCGSRSCAPFLVRREIHKCPPSDLSLLGAACALALIGTLAAPARAAGGLAPDGDFEAAPFASYYTHGAGSFTWASDQHYSGTHSLKIVSGQPAGALARWMTNTDAIRVTPGTTYTASAVYKTESVAAGEATLAASFWTASGVWTGTTVTSPTGLSGTNTWRLLDLQARAPAGSVSVRIELRLYGPGTIWVDDLSVTSQTAGPPVALVQPSISGLAQVGQTLIGDPGVWAGTQPITITFEWLGPDYQYSGMPVGRGLLTYPDELVAGTRVTFRVVASNAEGVTYTGATSALIQPAPNSPPVGFGFPILSGTPRVGDTVRTSTGEWLGQVDSFSYQWFRETGGPLEPIPGAVGSSYAPSPDDVGHALAAQVTATNTHGSDNQWAYICNWRDRVTCPGSPSFLLVIGPVEPAQQYPNLVPNADVEAQPDAVYYTHGTGSFSWASDQSVSPTHSLKIVSAQPPGGLARWMTHTDAIRAIPGASYDASAWLKTNAVSQHAELAITFWAAGGNYLGVTASSAQTPTGTTDWTEVTAHATAPAGSAFVRVELRLYGPGTLWADNLSLSKTG